MKLRVYLTERMYCVERGDFHRKYFFPCGEKEAKLGFIDSLLKEGTVTFEYIREQDKRLLEEYFPGRFEFFCLREDWEYIYQKEEQVSLSGGRFKHLRSKVRKGKNAHDWSVDRLSVENKGMAAEITRRWSRENKHYGQVTDIKAAMNALEFYDQLNLSGIILSADKVPLAYALGAVISPDTFDLHISKTLESNIDCYLKWELFRQLPKEILYINREEDLGIEGLRIHKTEMKPVRFNELWEGRTRK